LINDIIPFPENLIYGWWLTFKASLKHKIGKLDEQLMSYRIHDNNAIGFLIINRDDKLKIDKIQESLETLTLFSKQKNTLSYK